jgi:multiple sugar transport system ATP-binding protein
MNLIEGDIHDGAFTARDTRIPGLTVGNGKVTLGFRAEDASLAAPGEGEITAPIYTLELLGDATMISVRIGSALVAVKADKTFRAEIGEPVSIHVPPEICHLFSTETGKRIDG